MWLKNLNIKLIFFIMLTALFSSFNIIPENYTKVTYKRTYTIGYMKNIFNEVDLNDAQAAIKVFMNEIVKSYKFSDGYTLKAKIYNHFDEVTEAMKKDSLAVLAVNTFDYLYYGEKIGLSPVFVPSTKGDIFEQYNILVRKEDGFKSVKDLKGANIGALSSRNHIASILWLDISLAKINIPDKAKFFKKVAMTDKESQLILDLFFGHLDACIVSKESFSLMKELNYQIGEKIISIQNSPKYLWGLTCFTRIFNDEKDKNIFYTSALKVNELNAGKQLFSLMKINKLDPFKNEYLNSYRDLIKEYSYLVKTKKISKDESI